jgi:hypothetical protein
MWVYGSLLSLPMRLFPTLLLILLILLPSSGSSVCHPAKASPSWAFSATVNDTAPSCASSHGACNDIGNAPLMCAADPASVYIAVQRGKAECLVAKAPQCKIPMHDFISLDYDFAVQSCNGIWAAPLWMTPDTWQWGPGSGEIDSEEMCTRDAIHLNFAGGGHQVRLNTSRFNIDGSTGHITVRKDEDGIVTIAACSQEEARRKNQNGGEYQCPAPVYADCAECLSGGSYGCWCNPNTNPPNIYGSGGCAPAGHGDCMWTLVSDIWNGVRGDGGYQGCMTAVPAIGLPAGKPNLNSDCKFSVEKITLRGGGVGGKLQWGGDSPSSCDVLTVPYV